jgi:RepB DNA-primase from phage plasmid
MASREGAIDAQAALAMLEAFASVGATAFDVTLLDIPGREQGFQRNRSLEELRHSIRRRLEAATEQQHSIVIRPRSTAALLIQLDDFTADKAAQLAPHAFMTVCTSPNNFQVWLAVSDGPQEQEAAKQFRTRVRRGAGADHSATGAVRLAGSVNFKTKYAPEFPLVAITWVKPGSLTTMAALEQVGLLAAPPLPPASVPRLTPAARPARGRYWPDYQQALRGAPLKGDGTRDRSLADFMFCKWAAERGWSIEETAEKLAEVSAKAQERIQVKADAGYTLLTARNAAAAVERERSRRQGLKGAAQP